MLGEILFLFY